MDNRLLNINGRSFYQFKVALKIALMDEYEDEDSIDSGVEGYKITKEKGLILYWHINKDSVKPIFELFELLNDKIIEKYNLQKSVRKYKLDILDFYKERKLKKRLTIPIDILTVLLWKWVTTYKGEIEYGDWENDLDHDGSNDKGFRIYTEDWGHISDGFSTDHYTKFAVKPVYLWYGK